MSLPVFDILFGTCYCPPSRWQQTYGLEHNDLGGYYLSCLVRPFVNFGDIRTAVVNPDKRSYG